MGSLAFLVVGGESQWEMPLMWVLVPSVVSLVIWAVDGGVEWEVKPVQTGQQ